MHAKTRKGKETFRRTRTPRSGENTTGTLDVFFTKQVGAAIVYFSVLPANGP